MSDRPRTMTAKHGCKIAAHGAYTGNACPQCCLHKAQVYFQDGPRCSECDRVLTWVSASQLKDAERSPGSSEQTIREACAKIAEDHLLPPDDCGTTGSYWNQCCREIAAAIRGGK